MSSLAFNNFTTSVRIQGELDISENDICRGLGHNLPKHHHNPTEQIPKWSELPSKVIKVNVNTVIYHKAYFTSAFVILLRYIYYFLLYCLDYIVLFSCREWQRSLQLCCFEEMGNRSRDDALLLCALVHFPDLLKPSHFSFASANTPL